jgi:hypothetical protein
MSSSTNRSLQQKALKLKGQNQEYAKDMAYKGTSFKSRVQVIRPMHERHEQRTRLLVHF